MTHTRKYLGACFYLRIEDARLGRNFLKRVVIPPQETIAKMKKLLDNIIEL